MPVGNNQLLIIVNFQTIYCSTFDQIPLLILGGPTTRPAQLVQTVAKITIKKMCARIVVICSSYFALEMCEEIVIKSRGDLCFHSHQISNTIAIKFREKWLMVIINIWWSWGGNLAHWTPINIRYFLSKSCWIY